ncbi:hypothetical protein [Lapillicoccus sp.]|uniref:COG4315 family predicted lipoprotein n=1 Tax=Lapillicoccus sp. TaxID=1909287 RepID=UPI0025EEB238|nr:hypothetical protein [Lapillicoccus sp.]
MSVRLDHPRPARPLLATVGGAAVLALTLAACGSSGTTAPAAASSSSTAAAPAAATAATVRVASTSLGKVVVDTAGRTLYMFTKDTKDSGKSVCAGQCATAWPAYTTTATPTADGVSGTLGTLTTAGGAKQVTLGGWPLYYFDKDKASGDVLGQDVGKVWFVLDSNGTPVEAGATTTG